LEVAEDVITLTLAFYLLPVAEGVNATELLAEVDHSIVGELLTSSELETDEGFLELLTDKAEDIVLNLLPHETQIEMGYLPARLEDPPQLLLRNRGAVTASEVENSDHRKLPRQLEDLTEAPDEPISLDGRQ